MAPFERAFVTSYRLYIVTFPLSLRVSEILRALVMTSVVLRRVRNRLRIIIIIIIIIAAFVL